VIGVDLTELLARAASHHDDPVSAVVADAAALPFGDGVADLVASFMTLMDTDDFAAAVSEVGRVLRPGGRYCIAIVHPARGIGPLPRRRVVPRRPPVPPGVGAIPTSCIARAPR
jgi:ubiquinone/menaquinone biosynthesis C-methylase UbiE